MSNERKPLNGPGISVPEDERTRRLLWASEAMLLLLLAVCLSAGGGPVLAALCVAAMAPAVVGHSSLFGEGRCGVGRAKEMEDV